MSDEEESEEERMSPQKRMEKVREKMKKMQQQEGSEQQGGPMGPSPLMNRMAAMQGGGDRKNEVMMKSMKQLRADMQDIKNYLKEILNVLKSGE